ncbi:hypothetical protein GCM10028818_15420 [Spirosoma horti]
MLFLLQTTLAFPQISPISARQDTIGRIAEEEQKRLIDPAINRVPYERLQEARQQLANKSSGKGARAGIPNITWQERGPSNSGGRTRTLLFDPNDPTHTKVWAGSVVGGLWYTTDITDANATWTPVSDSWESTIVTAIAADPSNSQVMYAGTGDMYNSRPGGGIWKTTNGGTNWTRLTSTIPGGLYPSVNVAFSYIQRIVVNSSGHLFVASKYGVVKSTDGGNSWSYALDPAQSIGTTGVAMNPIAEQVTDLEIGSDGVMYAAFYGNRLYKSDDGITWVTITPAGAPLVGRTELALAPSTSGAGQVLYCVAVAYSASDYGQDINWFKKSTDGGTTWTDIRVPTFTGGNHFTNGNGYYALSLVVHPTDPTTVYAGGYNWFRSIDSGNTWSRPLINDYSYQHYLLFQPGNTQSAAFCNDQGVFWSANWSDVTAAQPTVLNKNNGYRVSEINSVSLRAAGGGSYILATSRNGTFKLTTAGLSTGDIFFTYNYPMGLSFIDEETPLSQLFLTAGTIYYYDGASTQYLASINGNGGSADYDSQSNTLYAADYNSSTGQYFLRKLTGIGSSTTATQLPLSGLTNSLSYLKLSKDRTALFAGTYSGKLYKITNVNQLTPTVTAIDNGALPPNTTISCIDVGATDNELLVTLSNYGVQSVWYTNDGGNTWMGKDQSNYGLPDVPVRTALFNPQSRKQVLLGTDLGIWSTDDIIAPNPGWTLTSTGLGTTQVNQLRYRASDGRMTAATNGRGIFTSDAFAIPYTPSTITLTSVSNATLCAGSSFNVSFTTTGPAFATGSTVEVWLSDANGSFTNQKKIGSGVTSPVLATLPSGFSAVPYGTNYRVKLIAPNADAESGVSSALAIGNLSGSFGISDRRSDAGVNYQDGSICAGGSVTLRRINTTGNPLLTSIDSSQWLLNGAPIAGATSSTYSAQTAGVYSVIIKQAGCSLQSNTYQLNIVSSIFANDIVSPAGTSPQCDDTPLKIQADYAGETGSYQWIRDGSIVAGVSSYSLAINQTGTYAVRITDGACASVISPNSYFQFGRSLAVRIAPSSAGDTLLCASSSGRSVYLFSQGNNPTGLYTYQWYKSGLAISGATSSGYSTNGPGVYTLAIRQGSCSTFSNPIVIRPANQLIPVIQTNSTDKNTSVCIGESVILSAQPYNIKYQWQKDGVDIPGQTSSSYAATQTGSYTVRVFSDSCSATSAPVSYTFSNTVTPKITYQTGAETCSSAYLYSNQSGAYPQTSYQYQWFKDGTAIQGAANSGYNVTQTGTYTIRVTSGSCQGVSKGVYVAIGKLSKPIIQVTGNTRTACLNSSVLLEAPFYTGSSLTWKRNGIPIAINAQNSFYATQSGFYTVTYSSFGGCTVESDPIEVKIGEPTSALLAGNALISSGTTANLPVTFTGLAPWSFTLTNGQSVTAIYQNPYLLTVSPTSTTTYQLASVINACGTGTTSGQASVSVGTGSADVSLQMVVSTRSPNVGNVVSYTMTAVNTGPNDALGVKLASVLPTGLSFVSSSSPSISNTNGVVSASLGNVSANNQVSVTFLASPTLPGTFAASAQITGSQTPDPDSQPNSGTGDGQDDEATADLRTTVNGSLATSANPAQVPLPAVLSSQPVTDPNTADLSLDMKVDKLSPGANETVSTSLTVSNRGGSSASSIVVQVVLPNGVALQASQSGWIQVDNQTYKKYINQLASSQSSTIVLQWQPTGSGRLKAQILDVAEADPDSTPGNGYTKGEDDEAALSVRMR